MLQRARAAAIVVVAALACGCSQANVGPAPSSSAAHAAAMPEKAPVPAPADASPMPGGDRDAKGCTGSAGYAWSHLNGKCIRIFETGIRMEPRAKNLDKTQSAFAVFAPGDDTRAEIFLPGRAPAILARDGDREAWRDGAYVLTRAKRSYTLAEVSGTRLYEGTAK